MNRRRRYRGDEGFADACGREAADAQTNLAWRVGRMRRKIGVVPRGESFRGEQQTRESREPRKTAMESADFRRDGRLSSVDLG